MSEKDKTSMGLIMGFLEAQEMAEKNGFYQFECPICGGKASWKRSAYNNHLHVFCKDCGIWVAE